MTKKAKMIKKLGDLYQQDPAKFRDLLPIKACGGERVLLARTPDAITKSGTSTKPTKILVPAPDSLWVIGGAMSGEQSAILVFRVMDDLDYPPKEIIDFLRDFLGTSP